MAKKREGDRTKWARALAAVVSLLSIGGSADAALTNEPELLTIEQRVSRVRSALLSSTEAPPAERAAPPHRTLQWPNWPNWPNWSNWPNWPNWNNWINWWNG